MLVRAWRWLTIMLTSLSLVPALAHLLEMPAKMTYDGALWLRPQQSLYVAFGTFGAALEVGAVVTTIVLVILVREYTHAARAVLQMIALGGLVFSVLAETPAGAFRRSET